MRLSLIINTQKASKALCSNRIHVSTTYSCAPFQVTSFANFATSTKKEAPKTTTPVSSKTNASATTANAKAPANKTAATTSAANPKAAVKKVETEEDIEKKKIHKEKIEEYKQKRFAYDKEVSALRKVYFAEAKALEEKRVAERNAKIAENEQKFKKKDKSNASGFPPVRLPYVEILDTNLTPEEKKERGMIDLSHETFMKEAKERRELKMQKREQYIRQMVQQKADLQFRRDQLRDALLDESRHWFTAKDLEDSGENIDATKNLTKGEEPYDKVKEKVRERLSFIQPLSAAFRNSLPSYPKKLERVSSSFFRP